MAREKKDKKTEAIKKASDIKLLKEAINKKYGVGTIIHASESNCLDIQRIPFGIFDFDLKIGGGLPLSRITVLHGLESCGKSTLALKVVGNAQKYDRITKKPFLKLVDGEWKEVNFGAKGREPDPMRIVWLDVEGTWTDSWSKVWGIDTENVLLNRPEYAEQGLDIADYCIRSKLCDLLVIDSIAAMAPGEEIEKSHEAWQMGVMARLLGKALRKFTSGMNSGGLLTDMKCSIIIINQMRQGMGKFGSYWTTPGGNSLKHFKSLDIDLKKKDFVIDAAADRAVGVTIDFAVEKNKTAAAQGKGTFKLYFNPSESLGKKAGETDEEEQIIKLATYWDILKIGKSGWCEVNGQKMQGLPKVVETFQQNSVLVEDVKRQIEECEYKWLTKGIGPKHEESSI